MTIGQFIFIELKSSKFSFSIRHWDKNGSNYYTEPANAKIPDSIDWYKKGAVTSVSDQGSCGSCWTFGVAGALEAQLFFKTKQLILLSKQNLLDCSKTYGNSGCRGGFPAKAFQYVTDNGGIDTESSYPYEGVDNNPCRYKPKDSAVKSVGYKKIRPGDERQLTSAIATVGPITIVVSLCRSFFRYNTGVYYDYKCNKILSHVMLAVGYGRENGRDYYLVKNSWGSIWGENGYVKMARNRNNSCEIATWAAYPLV